MTGHVIGAILLIAALIIVVHATGIRDWHQRTTHDQAQRIERENEAIRLANDGEWRLFVLHHPLDDACPNCSLWDAEGDRPVIKPCDKHKEEAQ
jgi:hypothetical protein